MNIEQRLTALERRANRYRSAFVLMVLTSVGVVLTGATATDDVQDVVRTKKLLVVNEDGQVVFEASTGPRGDGLLRIRSKSGEDLISAGALTSDDGGYIAVRSKTGNETVRFYADEFGHGVVTGRSNSSPLLRQDRYR